MFFFLLSRGLLVLRASFVDVVRGSTLQELVWRPGAAVHGRPVGDRLPPVSPSQDDLLLRVGADRAQRPGPGLRLLHDGGPGAGRNLHRRARYDCRNRSWHEGTVLPPFPCPPEGVGILYLQNFLHILLSLCPSASCM